MQCATARLAEAKDTWDTGGGLRPPGRQAEQQQAWPQLALAPWASRLSVATSVAAPSSVAGGGGGVAGSQLVSLDALCSLNTSILRRFMHRLQHVQSEQMRG